MVALSQPQIDAANEIANATITALTMKGGIHPATIVAGVARMAGTYLFRSFGLPLPETIQPGQAVLSEVANEKGPPLIGLAGTLLQRMNVSLPASMPEPSTDPQKRPAMDFLGTQRRLEPAYEPIRAKHGLTDEQAAHATAAATALLVRHCSQWLDAGIAFGIAAYGFVEGTKTAPDPVTRAPAIG